MQERRVKPRGPMAATALAQMPALLGGWCHGATDAVPALPDHEAHRRHTRVARALVEPRSGLADADVRWAPAVEASGWQRRAGSQGGKAVSCLRSSATRAARHGLQFIISSYASGDLCMRVSECVRRLVATADVY